MTSASADLSAARAQQEALKALARPIARDYSRAPDLGDGDVCPVDPKHRRMYHLSKRTQWCADQSHDVLQEGRRVTPNSWPVQFFGDAVAEWRASLTATAGEAEEPLDLPDIDMEGF